MKKLQFSLTFFIYFLVLWEVSAASDTKKGNPNSECPDSFAVSEAGDPNIENVERLEAILRYSDNVAKKNLAIQLLVGKIGETQSDSSTRVVHILTNTFQDKGVKEQAMDTTTMLVIKLSSEELASQLIDQLIVVFLREVGDNLLMPTVALNNLQVLTLKYPQKAVVAFKNFFKGIGLKVHMPEESENQLSLFEVDEKYKIALREIDKKYEITGKRDNEHFEMTYRKINERHEITSKRDNERAEVRSRMDTELAEAMYKRDNERAEVRSRMDTELAEAMHKRDNERSKIALRKRADERRNESMMRAAHVYIQIIKRSPSTVQEEIALFLKEEVLDSSEYSQTVKDMALKIYGEFARYKNRRQF